MASTNARGAYPIRATNSTASNALALLVMSPHLPPPPFELVRLAPSHILHYVRVAQCSCQHIGLPVRCRLSGASTSPWAWCQPAKRHSKDGSSAWPSWSADVSLPPRQHCGPCRQEHWHRSATCSEEGSFSSTGSPLRLPCKITLSSNGHGRTRGPAMSLIDLVRPSCGPAPWPSKPSRRPPPAPPRSSAW